MGAVVETLTINHPSAKQPRMIRLSRNIRRTIDLMTFDGCRLADALQTVGITQSAYYLAARKPEFSAYQQECVRVKLSHAKARTVAKAELLMDTAVSEHVQMQAVQYLNPPVQRSENMHVHQHLIPGLTIVFEREEQPGDSALLIGDQRVGGNTASEINMLGTSVPHPAMKNAAPEVIAPPAGPSNRKAARTTPGGQK